MSGIVNKAEVDDYLKCSCFFDGSTDVGNLNSGSSAFSNSSLNIWKFTFHISVKSFLENFGHYFTKVWDGFNFVVAWGFFGIAFLWHWNENWRFPVLWPLLSFPNLLAHWVQHFHSIIFQRRHSNTVLSQSLWGLWVLVHTRFVWALWASLADMGFYSKCDFVPPTILLGILLSPILEEISPEYSLKGLMLKLQL